MKIRYIFALAGICFYLVGCGGHKGWVHYKSAMKCHFENDDKNCVELYDKAIEEKYDLPGVHSSKGAHLQSKGQVEEAQKEYAIEISNYPFIQKSIDVVNKKNAKESETEASENTGNSDESETGSEG